MNLTKPSVLRPLKPLGRQGDYIETFEQRYVRGIGKSIELYEFTMSQHHGKSGAVVPNTSEDKAATEALKNERPKYHLVVDVPPMAFWYGSADLLVSYKQGPHIAWCDPLFPSALFGTVLGAFQLQVPNQLGRERSAYFSSAESQNRGNPSSAENFAVAHLRIELDWKADNPEKTVARFLQHLRYITNRRVTTRTPPLKKWILMSGAFTDEKLMGAALRLSENSNIILEDSSKEMQQLVDRSLEDQGYTQEERVIVTQLIVLQRLKNNGVVDFVTHAESRFSESFGDLELEERAIFQMALAVRAEHFYASTSWSSASHVVEGMRRIQGKSTYLDTLHASHPMGKFGHPFFNGVRGCAMLDLFEEDQQRISSKLTASNTGGEDDGSQKSVARSVGLDCREYPLSENVRGRYERFWEVSEAPSDFQCPLRDQYGRRK